MRFSHCAVTNSLVCCIYLLLISVGKAWVTRDTRPSLSPPKVSASTLSGWSRHAEISTEPKKVSIYTTFQAAAEGRNNGKTGIDTGSRPRDLASPREWLESLPNGAYTVLRCDYVHGGWKIWGLDFHLSRLKESFRCWMLQTEHQIGLADYATPESDTKTIIQALLSCAKKKVVVSAERIIEGFTDSFMITILWYNQPGPNEKIAVRGHILSLGSRSDPRIFHVDPVSVMVGHIGNATEQAALPNRMPYPRAKLSTWCSQRRPLERIFKRSGIGEVLLVQIKAMKDSVKLLEGLTSNVFLLFRDGVIRTASQDVLLGYARHRILQSAQRLGIPVDTSTAVDILDCDQWQEVFLSSATKILVPVEKVLVLTESSESDKPNYEVLWSYEPQPKQDTTFSLCKTLYQDIIENELFD